MAVSFNGKHLAKFIRPEEYEAIYPQVELAHNQLESKTGAGNDFLGWLDLPVTYDKEEFARIKEAAQKIQLGFRCAARRRYRRFLSGRTRCGRGRQGPVPQLKADDGLKIYFCGNTISPTALNDIIKLTKGKRYLHQRHLQVRHHHRDRRSRSACCASCWRIQYGVEEANKRIYATTDQAPKAR